MYHVDSGIVAVSPESLPAANNNPFHLAPFRDFRFSEMTHDQAPGSLFPAALTNIEEDDMVFSRFGGITCNRFCFV